MADAGTQESSGPISDRVIVGVLRPFVRATRPVLDALREADPFGLRSRVISTDAGAPQPAPEETDRGVRDRVLDFLATVEHAALGFAGPAQPLADHRGEFDLVVDLL